MFNFAALVPAFVPDAQEKNEAIFASGNVLGIEVSIPALAAPARGIHALHRPRRPRLGRRHGGAEGPRRGHQSHARHGADPARRRHRSIRDRQVAGQGIAPHEG